jgi:hypothetical protein
MTAHAIVGVTLYNLVLGGMGGALMFGLRPDLSPRDHVRLAGVSYLLGVAAAMVAFTLVLVLGIPLDWPSLVVCVVLPAGAGVLVGRRRRRQTTEATLVPSLTLPSAAVLALAFVILEAVFRKGRLQGLLEFDGWDSWGPKAKALYFFGHLRPSFLADLPGGSYPPGLPALLSGALHFIGAPDTVTVHLQFWFLAVGFIVALIGLLAGRVDPLLLFVFALLVFVMPDIRSRSVDMYGDLTLGYAIATVSLLLALWVGDRSDWRIVVAAVLSAGAVLTKREGLVLAICVVAAATVASAGRLRHVWLRLGAVLGAAVAAWLVWQIWLSAESLPGNSPSGGLHFLSDPGRGWSSLRTVVDNLFTFDLWLVTPTIGIAAVALCLVVREWRLAGYTATLFVLLVLGCSAILWSDPNLQLSDVNVVSRLVGTIPLCVVAVTPLLLQRAWGTVHMWRVPAWHRALAWGAVATAAVAYPVTLLTEGGARFPKASDCNQPGALYADSYPAAERIANGGKITQDGCGRLRVEPR